MFPMSSIESVWYEQGHWPLIGAIAVLIFTNIVSVWQIFVQANTTHKKHLSVLKIELLERQLSEFYNPLFALVKANGEMFASAGPQTFPKEHARREAAAQVWNRIKIDSILPNNKAMQEILRTKTHLLIGGDEISNYIPLLMHVTMYEIFHDQPTELYERYQFPKGIAAHLSDRRKTLAAELLDLRKGGDVK